MLAHKITLGKVQVFLEGHKNCPLTILDGFKVLLIAGPKRFGSVQNGQWATFVPAHKITLGEVQVFLEGYTYCPENN